MKRALGLLLAAWLTFPALAFGDAFQWDSGYKSDAPDAVDVNVSTTNFSGALSSADTNMQAALDTLDDAGTSPAGATYITQTAHAQLSAEQAIGALASGILRGATTTGVITVLTTSAGISDNISDEQGSGALVFATSPTLTTPVLGVASATSLTLTTDLAVADGGTGVSTLADGGVLIGKGTAALETTGVLTDGTAIVGDGVTNPTTVALLSSSTGTLTAARFPILTGDVTTAGGALATTIAADSVALTTDTTGNYVASVADGSGVDVTGTAGEGWTATVNLVYTDTLAANPTMNAEETRFSTDGTGGGLIFEGLTADTIEGLLAWSPTTSDRTITLPDATSTLTVQSDNLSVFAATTSAQLAGVLSDESGSGVALFGTSPTITTSLTQDGDAADAGYLRLANTAIIGWEASPAGTDVTLAVDASEEALLDGAVGLGLDDQADLRFYETDANGSNFLAFEAPAAITTTSTCTLENDANPIPDSCVGDGVDTGGTDVGGTNALRAQITGDFTTTSTTFVDITDVRVTITPSASNPVAVGFTPAGCQNTTIGDGVALAVEVDGARVYEELAVVQTGSVSSNMSCTIAYMTAALAASAQIIDIQARAITGGTATVGGPKIVYAFETVD